MRTAIYTSGGENLNKSIEYSAVCKGTTGQIFNKGQRVILADKRKDGNYDIAYGVATGKQIQINPTEIWENWQDHPKCVVNHVSFFAKKENIPAHMVNPSRTDIPNDLRESLWTLSTIC